MIAEARNPTYPITIYHEMAGDLNEWELESLRKNGFMVVGVVRNPRKQLSSLLRLLPGKLDNVSNLFEVGWKNLDHYLDKGMIDYVIDSERYLSDRSYRQDVHQDLGICVNEKMLESMTRYRGKEFHKICTITTTWENNDDPQINQWNAIAGNSLRLLPDETLPIRDDAIPPSLRVSLVQANEIYERLR